MSLCLQIDSQEFENAVFPLSLDPVLIANFSLLDLGSACFPSSAVLKNKLSLVNLDSGNCSLQQRNSSLLKSFSSLNDSALLFYSSGSFPSALQSLPISKFFTNNSDLQMTLGTIVSNSVGALSIPNEIPFLNTTKPQYSSNDVKISIYPKTESRTVLSTPIIIFIVVLSIGIVGFIVSIITRRNLIRRNNQLLLEELDNILTQALQNVESSGAQAQLVEPELVKYLTTFKFTKKNRQSSMRSINSSSRDNTFLTRRGTDKSEKSVTFGTYNGGTPSSEIGRSASVKSYSESVNSSIQPRAKDGELDSSNFSFSVANQSANSLPNASVLVPIDNEVLNSSAPAVQQSAIAASTTRPTISRTLTRPLYRNSSFTVHRQISLSSSKNVRGWKTSTNTPKKFTTLRKLSTADVCSICLEEYVVGDDLLRLPEPCSHVYHGKCVVEWISETSPTCPMCRRNIRDLLLEIKNIDDVEKEEKVAISSSLEET